MTENKYVKPMVYTVEMDDVVLAGTSSSFNIGNDDNTPVEDGGFNAKQRGGNSGMWKYMED